MVLTFWQHHLHMILLDTLAELAKRHKMFLLLLILTFHMFYPFIKISMKSFGQTLYKTAPTPLEKSLHQKSRSRFWWGRSPVKLALISDAVLRRERRTLALQRRSQTATRVREGVPACWGDKAPLSARTQLHCRKRAGRVPCTLAPPVSLHLNRPSTVVVVSTVPLF